MNRILLCAITLLSFILFISGCGDDEPEISSRTVIVYIICDNNLNGYAQNNLNDMEAGYTSGNLIVYVDSKNNTPRIYKIANDNTDEIVSTVVQTYEEQNSTDPAVMRSVLNDIINKYPSESYGLILWSHGTTWYPDPTRISPRWFGQDGSSYMNIQEFSEAIPGNKFEYIIFDACLMGSVEVAYELRDKADYLLAAATVTMANGFPYKTVTPTLMGKAGAEQTLKQVGKAFYEYYNAQSGESQTGNMALIDLLQIDDLVAVTKELINSEGLATWPDNSAQRLCYGSGYGSVKVSYDFLDFLEKNFTDEAKLAAVKEQIDKTVISKWTTYKAYGDGLSTFCGLGSYIPNSSASYTSLNTFYKTLGWYTAAGYDALFFD